MWWPPPIVDLANAAPVSIGQADRPDWLFWSLMGPCTVFWLLAYLFAIHRAKIDEYSGVPVLVVGVNFAWEFAGAFIVEQEAVQRPIDFCWMVLDIFILRQALKYGGKDYPTLRRRVFQGMIIGILLWTVFLVVAAAYEFGDRPGIYSGTAINVFLSLSWIFMLKRRGSSAGQSMYIAMSKFLGSFFAGWTVFVMFPGRYLFVVWFLTVWTLDIVYMVLLHRQIRAEGASPWALKRPVATVTHVTIGRSMSHPESVPTS
ncbi:hypothetical protein SAMN05421504_12018 [Amycolatopsis xylanica]|uniref:Uncharacterized protein n=1 Tax=Amycolatopsis xylanica TaxID=589385 RepID=A0A1H3T8V9_9PSEU|nr:hypothetical protein [Amycolatopsis xylanica]SDZ46666.1 hypothetical protein SAMN05421504_12018 [Amycolatopsis xylanica]